MDPNRSKAARLFALLALLALSAFLVACGGGSGGSSGSTGGEATTTDSGEPVKGGTLKFARTADADVGLNPIDAPSNGSIFTIQQIFDQLVEVGEGDEPEPGLAESWETSKDGLVWTFHLRDAQFSNGEPVTAEDVKFSVDRFSDPEININYATLGEAIKSTKVDRPENGADQPRSRRRRLPRRALDVRRGDRPEKSGRTGRRQSLRRAAGRLGAVRSHRVHPRPAHRAEKKPALLARRAALSRRSRLRVHARRQHPGAETALRRGRRRRRHPLQPGRLARRRPKGSPSRSRTR